MGDDNTLQVFIVSGVMNVVLGLGCLLLIKETKVAWLAGGILMLVGAGLIVVGTV